jgi:hypothetical protein
VTHEHDHYLAAGIYPIHRLYIRQKASSLISPTHISLNKSIGITLIFVIACNYNSFRKSGCRFLRRKNMVCNQSYDLEANLKNFVQWLVRSILHSKLFVLTFM